MSNFKNIAVKKYFLYRHIRLDANVPFYVGIGVNNRRTTRTRYYERAYQTTGRNNWWKRIVNRSEYNVEIIYETDFKNEIVEKEKEFILIYGRKDLGLGTLVNLTNGGDGILDCSEDTRKKISNRMMGNRHGYKPNKKIKVKIYGKGLPFYENHRIALRGTKPNAKPVYCTQNGMTYNSMGECVRLLFNCELLSSSSKFRTFKHGIKRVCNNTALSYKKFNFKFI